jgi:peptidoglycan/xylan/chitin deacetylase (PgdA/CDA1 family)
MSDYERDGRETRAWVGAEPPRRKRLILGEIAPIACCATEQPLLALTFDDGPSPWTEAVLGVLAANDATATFFVLGAHVSGNEPALGAIVRAGCEIGVHGFSHHRFTELSDSALRGELTTASRLIEDATGVQPVYWRAPYVEADDRVRRLCANAGLTEIWFSVFTEDYHFTRDQIVERVLTEVHPGAIILMHDGRAPGDGPADSNPTRDETVAALKILIPSLRRAGYSFVTVSGLLSRGAPVPAITG